MTATIDDIIDQFRGKTILRREELVARSFAGGGKRVQTLNLHHIALFLQNFRFREAVAKADLLTADGWPVVVTLRLAGIAASRVTGADLVADLVRHPDANSKRFGLLGASTDVGDKFEDLLSANGSKLVFREHGDRSEWNDSELVARLRETDVDILLIAISPPWGDEIASRLADSGSCGFVIAVGGAVDMVTGARDRAPVLLQRLGIEWFYRMVQDPKHLLHRYIVECGKTLVFSLVPAWGRMGWRRLRGGVTKRNTV
ncbi:WecB/TagA/CpsF family glycosyltransferase [Rhodococcus pyridinivorans]|uniref:WecB/TagA/CpsF family glycosyltransferase n=1 Tax=Rhodococcus pyridinivorans TaxID=103816 RepID=UPI0037C851C9